MRRAGVLVLWCWWVLGAGSLALRWVDATGPVPVVQALLPPIGLSLALLLVLALVVRRWLLSVLTVGVLLVLAVLALPWWTGSGAEPRPADEDVSVAVVNLHFGGGSPEDVETLVTQRDVDALVLLEVTETAHAAIVDGPVGELLPHGSGRSREGAEGTVVLTRDPHEELSDSPAGMFDQIAVRVASGSGDWVLLGAHPAPPLPDAQQWRRDLRRIQWWREQQDADLPLVIAGDLNSSQGHPAFRALAETMDSAHRERAAGWVRTWSRERAVPFVQLDHVLTRGVTVVDAGTAEITDTDHLGVWARLRLPS